MNRIARSISMATRSYRSPAREVQHELLVPLVHPGQVAHAGGGDRADQVHRRRRVGVGADHPGRVGHPRLRGGGQRVDDVAAVGRQAQRVDRRRSRLGVLPGDPGHLDHRQRRAVGQHDRHLQQGADVAADVRLGVVDVGLGAVAALQQERLAAGDGGQLVGQLVDLAGHGHRRHGLQHRADRQHLLGSGHSGCCAAGRASASSSRSRRSGGSGGRLGRMSAGMSIVQFTPDRA